VDDVDGAEVKELDELRTGLLRGVEQAREHTIALEAQLRALYGTAQEDNAFVEPEEQPAQGVEDAAAMEVAEEGGAKADGEGQEGRAWK
jgi:hypothetical protein